MDAIPQLQAFAPLDAGPTTGFLSSVTISATTSASAATALPGSTSEAGATAPQNIVSYKQIQIANQTNGWAYVNVGQQGLAAATVAAGYPVAPGAVVVITVNGTYNYASVILASGTTSGSVIFTRGQGL